MKNTLLFFLFLSPYFMNGQQSGEVTYEMTLNIHKSMESRGREVPEEFKEMIPEFQTVNFLLQFTENVSVYQMSKDQPVDPQEAERGGRGGGFMMRMMRGGMGESKVFMDLENGKKVEEKVFLDKKFLIKDEIKSFPWKITGEMEEVAGHNCMVATYQDTLESVKVWFTSDIPVSTGPERYAQLPGMVLKVDINEGERVTLATNIEFKEMDEELFKIPKKGKEVTEEEFREIQREKMGEMRGQGGGPGMHIMRRPH